MGLERDARGLEMLHLRAYEAKLARNALALGGDVRGDAIQDDRKRRRRGRGNRRSGSARLCASQRRERSATPAVCRVGERGKRRKAGQGGSGGRLGMPGRLGSPVWAEREVRVWFQFMRSGRQCKR